MYARLISTAISEGLPFIHLCYCYTDTLLSHALCLRKLAYFNFFALKTSFNVDIYKIRVLRNVVSNSKYDVGEIKSVMWPYDVI